jgi:hypothetical protein
VDPCNTLCEGAKALAAGITGNTVLEEHILLYNEFGDEGEVALTESLACELSAFRVLSFPQKNWRGRRRGAAEPFEDECYTADRVFDRDQPEGRGDEGRCCCDVGEGDFRESGRMVVCEFERQRCFRQNAQVVALC